jgi:hypothetical protein
MPYYEYLEFLCKSHLSVSMSVDEGFSAGWTEQVSTGNPVIFPNKDWVHELFGGDYPFVYNDKTQLMALIKYIYKHYEVARNMVQFFAQQMVDDYDLGKVAQDYLVELEKSLDNTYSDFREWDKKWLRVLGEMPEEFTFEKFIRTAEKMTGASFGTYVILIGAYRNVYFWLKEHAESVLGKENTFRKVLKILGE